MAHLFNVVHNPNGTYTIEDLQQICSIDGQSVQLVVEDINNGANVITQPILAYTTTPENTEQTLCSPQTINLGAHVTAHLDSRPSVFIIKTNDPPVQQSIYTKAESGNSRFQTDNIKDSKDQLSLCYTQPQTHWVNPRENNETFELVIKEEPTNVKNFSTNIVRNQQFNTTQPQSVPPNAVVQGGSDKQTTKLIPLTKRNSISGAPVGILRTTLQGPNAQVAKVGKMKRQSTPNNSQSSRARLSTSGLNTNHVVSPPRTPQARPPIHADSAQKGSLASTKTTPIQSLPAMNQLSERIRQATLKQRQKLSDNPKQPMMIVNPTPRTTQSQPAQRQRSMGHMMTMNRQQLELQQQQQQQQLQALQHQQQQQRLQQIQQANQRQHAAQQTRHQAQASTMTDDLEPIEVESSEIVDKLNQVNSALKNDHEDNSSESVAYLQQEIDDPHTSIVQQQIVGNEAKMLVILENGEQRLITFEVPKEDCTVQDLLEQANIFSSHEAHVTLVSDPALNINYIVEVLSKSSVVEREQSVESTPNETTNIEPKTTAKQNSTSPQVTPQSRAPKYIKGMLAVCSFCGMSAADFNYCMRCKRKLPENVKAISIYSGVTPKKENTVPVDTFYKKTEPSSTQKSDLSKRGRGRGGRGMTTRAKLVKEPECLTISSDEEDDSRKHKRLEDHKDAGFASHITPSEESETILEKEPVITNTTVSPVTSSQNPGGGTGEQSALSEPISNLSTQLLCRTVRIGSYKYIPNDQILISSEGLKLEVPLLEDEKSFITIDIKFHNLVKVLIHFSKSMPVLFFYTNVTTGLMIRDLLGMQDPKGPYFDPASIDHTHKRITLLPEEINEESRTILKKVFKPIFEELNTKEANDILVKASPKAKSQVQTRSKKVSSASSSSSSSNGVIQTITVYPPPPAKGGIAINTEDFMCLAEDQFLNDVIIDFYLKYLTSEVLSPIDHNRTHIFSSYFYKRLTSPHTQAAVNTENLSAAAKRHARVQKWTKNVNIFEKDFIVIPINEHAHWFLAIICFPGLVGKVTPKVEVKSENQKVQDKKKKDVKTASLTIGSTTITPVSTITIDTNDDSSERDEAEGDDEEMETDSDDDDETDSQSTDNLSQTTCQPSSSKDVVKVPCILIFDSLAGASRARVVATLRDYLKCEYQAKMGVEKLFSKDTIKGACPKVPQQSNFTDCGLYVLQYVESFFQIPIVDYTLPIKTLKNWFEEIVVTRKREEIAKLLTELVNNTATKLKKVINLPALAFPTQDGKLKQKPEGQSKAEIEIKKKTVSESGDSKSYTTSTSDSSESSNESSNKSGVSQASTPQASTQITYTTDGTLIIQKEPTATTSAKSSTDTMAFLKNKRIHRLQKSSDNPQEEKQHVAKKHKGDSFDSCK